jgi:hypothetical protein
MRRELGSGRSQSSQRSLYMAVFNFFRVVTTLVFVAVYRDRVIIVHRLPPFLWRRAPHWPRGRSTVLLATGATVQG